MNWRFSFTIWAIKTRHVLGKLTQKNAAHRDLQGRPVSRQVPSPRETIVQVQGRRQQKHFHGCWQQNAIPPPARIFETVWMVVVRHHRQMKRAEKLYGYMQMLRMLARIMTIVESGLVRYVLWKPRENNSPPKPPKVLVITWLHVISCVYIQTTKAYSRKEHFSSNFNVWKREKKSKKKKHTQIKK